jgi:hypothetical protein
MPPASPQLGPCIGLIERPVCGHLRYAVAPSLTSGARKEVSAGQCPKHQGP